MTTISDSGVTTGASARERFNLGDDRDAAFDGVASASSTGSLQACAG
jgi:hypothetical protein